MLNNNHFTQLAVCATLPLALLSTQTADAQTEPDQPLNVVLMLADDMGYADVNAFGGRFGYTPNIDRLAAMGMTMTDFHSACAVCSPTRAALLTGRYPLANGIDGHFPDKPSTFLRDQTRADGGPGTLPGLLRERGYSTFHVGKWHLGGVTLVELEHRTAGQGRYADNQGPHEHGFDHYYISLEDAQSGIRAGMLRSATLYRDGVKHLVHNDVYTHNPDEQRDWQGFKGDVVTQHITQCTEAGQPFYLNVWFDVPHTPYEYDHVPEDFHFDTLSQQFDENLGRNRHVLNTDLPVGKHQENHRRFLSMVTYMDHQVGRILDALDDPNGDGDTADSIMNNTLIIFTSDNGGAWPADNGVFASGKANVRNGGIRVPMIVAWDNHVTPGTTSPQIGNTIDLLPSVHRLAVGEDLPAGLTVDGIDLSPVWLGDDERIDRGVMFSDLRKSYGPQRHGPRPEPQGHFVARRGDLKLIFDHKRSLTPVALFDMSTDAAEQDNLIDQPEFADDIVELTEAAKGWLAEMDAATASGSGD